MAAATGASGARSATPNSTPAPRRPTRRVLTPLLPGLLLTVALATAGFWLADLAWVKSTLHVSALLLVILIGMLWKSILPEPPAVIPGIRLAQRPILRWAVAGL